MAGRIRKRKLIAVRIIREGSFLIQRIADLRPSANLVVKVTSDVAARVGGSKQLPGGVVGRSRETSINVGCFREPAQFIVGI